MRDTKNKNQGYCCGFFQAIVDCFSQCCSKKPPKDQDFLNDYAEGLFDDSRTETLNYHELDVTPRLVSTTQAKAKAKNETYHVELPRNHL